MGSSQKEKYIESAEQIKTKLGSELTGLDAERGVAQERIQELQGKG